MALTKKQKAQLDIAMAGKKAADRLVAKMDANLALDAREKRELKIALTDKRVSDEIITDLIAVASVDQAAVDAAQLDVDNAQAVVDADVIAVALAQAALDADPGNPTLEAALAAAQATLLIDQGLLAAKKVILDTTKATQEKDLLSSRSAKALTIAMSSKTAGAALKTEIEK